MKTKILATVVSSWFMVPASFAATTIDSTNCYAYAANLGWVDARGDTSNGAVIGEYVCSGFIYSANVGWINLGSGAPTNQIQYQNNSANDFGVNHDGIGNLRGYAYGANIGWLNFESTGTPAVDLVTGQLRGFLWSANCGWISLSNTTASVRTTAIVAGADSDGDGIPDAWELTYTNTLVSFTLASDADGDGMSDRAEYLADTNPTHAVDNLRITSFQRGLQATPTQSDLEWTSQPTRQYAVQFRSELGMNEWVDFLLLPALGTNRATWLDAEEQRFYRIRAFRPLTP